MEDFNCHSTAWGNSGKDANGEEREQWTEKMILKLIFDFKQPASINSERWHRGDNTNDRIGYLVTKIIEKPLPRKSSFIKHEPKRQAESTTTTRNKSKRLKSVESKHLKE